MSIRHPLLAAVLTLGLLGSSSAAPVGAVTPTDPCALLFVPEGYQLRCSVQRRAADDWRLVIRPQNSLFAPLSELSIEPVEEPIEDPEEWLRGQLRRSGRRSRPGST